MNKVYITRKLPEAALAIIKQQCEVTIWDKEDTPVPREVLQEQLKNADGLLCLLTERIDEQLLEAAPNLKVISNMAVGYNNIDVEAATKRSIAVTNTPGVLTETTADLTFALLLATSRRLIEASNYLRDGQWKTWSPMQLTGQDIFGATLGIIGMGRIGESVAKRAKGFDMKLLYYNRSRKLEAEQAYDMTYADMDTLLSQSDFIVVLTPYSPDTVNLIDREQFARMKNTSVLINTARGGIVNEDALYDALTGGQIWAAGLDVFETEPLDPNHRLLTLPNVVAMPHIGSASIKTRTQMAILAAENLVRGVSGERPVHLVNPEINIY
ncbi:2-hydroxyacid dehydrogenase [Paenibacillus radicis (ex Xue et al. 2023)]|uniref:D-glycerate dehydrogenase n=1 Tax=Paenibacillus radicis (ex Xue et al. 2023) TaxID=2972489 RepID=A0ABT1Y9T3_9BACL|nr:D-glycerate dehydrogenase [Paenibacillus radicis (ex Xue et al. 2023)]MCR8629942.1 D-glycerate dehydrogenase [Paenibacillus radicis (ex Xue et al. 2023)]